MESIKKNKIKNIISIAITIVLVFVVSMLLIRNTCYLTIVISGESMSPTLNNGDYGYAIKTNYAKKHINRFDIMVFEDEVSHKNIIKRVIGLPGETISFKNEDSDLYVNENMIDQYFIDDAIKAQTITNSSVYQKDDEIVIPNDAYFVLGDNRSNSKDSLHGLGFIYQKQVKGILTAIIANCREISVSGNREICNDKYYKGITFF